MWARLEAGPLLSEFGRFCPVADGFKSSILIQPESKVNGMINEKNSSEWMILRKKIAGKEITKCGKNLCKKRRFYWSRKNANLSLRYFRGENLSLKRKREIWNFATRRFFPCYVKNFKQSTFIECRKNLYSMFTDSPDRPKGRENHVEWYYSPSENLKRIPRKFFIY